MKIVIHARERNAARNPEAQLVRGPTLHGIEIDDVERAAADITEDAERHLVRRPLAYPERHVRKTRVVGRAALSIGWNAKAENQRRCHCYESEHENFSRLRLRAAAAAV